MKPKEYEEYVAHKYQQEGYKTTVTPLSGDWGVDVIAVKGSEKIAIQAKMYAGSRDVNRAMIMELYGAMAYQDCTKAVIATDGNVLDDAKLVAKKLGIEIKQIPQCDISYKNECQEKEIKSTKQTEINGYPTFDEAWEKYIIPLKGKTLHNSRGKNKIEEVNWGGIIRTTSNGKKGKIAIEDFRKSYNELLRKKTLTRDEINQQNAKRCSSGIVLILSQIPYIEVIEKPNITLRLK